MIVVLWALFSINRINSPQAIYLAAG